MKTAVNALLGLGAISLVIGIVTRLTTGVVPIAGGIEPMTFLVFANTCLLISLVLLALEK